MYNFDFDRPTSIDAAVESLKTEEAIAFSGGQTLMPTMKQRLAMPSKVVSLTAIEEMKGVRQEGSELWIGGATTHYTVMKETQSSYPALSSLAGRIGDPSVRARGTIGGSLANNDPSACYPAGTLASKGVIVTNTREIPADEFFQGMFMTALEEGEIITAVKMQVPQAAHYAKMIQPASRFPLTAVFVAKYDDGVRVAVTGASEGGVFRWSEAEEALSQDFSAGAVEGLSAPDGSGMISDLHGTGAYRANLVKVMTKRAVAAC